MATKEELYKLAEELAKECYECLFRRNEMEPSSTATAKEFLESIERNQLVIEKLSELKGFFNALVYAGIFDNNDVEKLIAIASAGTDLPPEVAKFLEGLDGLKNFGLNSGPSDDI